MPLTRFQDNSPARQPASQVHTAFALCSSPHHRSPRACLSKPLPLLMLTVSRIERAQLAPAHVASTNHTQQHVFAPKAARHRTAAHHALQHCLAWRSPARHCTALHSAARHCTSSHGIAQHCTALAQHRTASRLASPHPAACPLARHRTATSCSLRAAQQARIFCGLPSLLNTASQVLC